VVEFVLVAPLLLLLLVALLQFALVLHVRATLTSAAAEGARAASLAGADAEAGVRRTALLLEDTVANGVVRDIRAGASVVGPIDVMVVRIDAHLPLVGLLGPAALSVEGRALIEGWT
jgi:hypothetical protein